MKPQGSGFGGVGLGGEATCGPEFQDMPADSRDSAKAEDQQGHARPVPWRGKAKGGRCGGGQREGESAPDRREARRGDPADCRQKGQQDHRAEACEGSCQQGLAAAFGHDGKQGGRG